MVFYHPLTFLNSSSFNIKEDKIDNAAVAILFLIFHELCGQYKKNMTNPDVPEQFYDNNYNILRYALGVINDSGNIFEYFLCFDVYEFYKKRDNTALLFEELYFNKSISNLNEIYPKNIFQKSFKKIKLQDITKKFFRLKIKCKDED